MNKIKKYLLTAILSFFLINGIYINIILDRDFLAQIGLEGHIILASLIFFIGTKVIAEYFFFSLKGLKKWFVGFYALFIITASILSIFFIRVWKAEKIYSQKESFNSIVQKKNQQRSQKINLYKDRLKELKEQINLKKSLIQKADKIENKWLRHRYNKEINELSKEEKNIFSQYLALINQPIKKEKHKESLQSTLDKTFGHQSKSFLTFVNLILAILVDGSLILLSFGLSYILKTESIEVNSNPYTKRNSRSFSSKSFKNTVPKQKNYISFADDFNGQELKTIREKLGKTQSEMAEIINISHITQRKISHYEKNQNEKIPNDMIERLVQLNIL